MDARKISRQGPGSSSAILTPVGFWFLNEKAFYYRQCCSTRMPKPGSRRGARSNCRFLPVWVLYPLFHGSGHLIRRQNGIPTADPFSSKPSGFHGVLGENVVSPILLRYSQVRVLGVWPSPLSGIFQDGLQMSRIVEIA